jgi:23S rRNA 5-hydroxycytidine C2501 synthase
MKNPNRSKTIELLAPARDLETGLAAIDCGADAVYIGPERFGAREQAGNSIQDIKALADHAHRYWAKAYAAVNTILRDEEIPQAVDLIHRLADAGVDGIIIQDAGLLECAPPLSLIASTQMHNDSPEKVEFLEKVGFSRVILARELSIEQIRKIRERTTIELEVFIHGALCVSYSGQCAFSFALGGRSGNRGECAQPCRKAYSVFDGKGREIVHNKHALSLKDLNLSGRLEELIDAGVGCFKIEGRLKDKAYVMNTVAYYRGRLDEIIARLGLRKASSGTSRIDFQPDPAKTFNRGFSENVLSKPGTKRSSWDTPKSVGESLGRVANLRRDSFTLDSSATVQPGDGLCFFDETGELQGVSVVRASGAGIYPESMKGIRNGREIRRNRDVDFIRAISRNRVERNIDVWIRLDETPAGFRLSARDEDGVEAVIEPDVSKTPAEKADIASDTIKRQLAKTGGTGFICRGVEVEWSRPYFFPASAINAKRRDLIEKLAAAREEQRPRTARSIPSSDAPYPEKNLTFLGNVMNRKAESFYKKHGIVAIEPAAESGIDMTNRPLLTSKYCIRRELDLCQSGSRSSEPMFLEDVEGRRFRLEFDCKACLMRLFLVS